jgi:hypothetical protein
MHEERIKVLDENEKYCKEEEEKRLKGEKSDGGDSEGDGFVDEDVSDGDESDGKDESEAAILKKIAKAKKGMEDAKDDDIDDYDEEEDSDYEYTGGDLAIYDSALDDVDELLNVKQILESMNA